MIINIILVILNLLLTGGIWWVIKKDNDFNLTLNKKEVILLICGIIINNVFVLFLNYSLNSKIFMSIFLSYLLMSAYTDAKTKKVYFIPFFIMPIMIIGLSSFNFWGLFIFIIPIILGLFRLYGIGDIPLVSIIGCIIFLNNDTVINSILLECIMLLIAEAIFLVVAIFQHNISKGKLKESKPLGPWIYISTFFVLLIHSLGVF